ncbi:hypothetical protein [Terriglobus sp. RCC_193]|uniref:hypothetical protein n=1 Tax=Terriglobus sp. RCC_193 TaxID=3239218 RepID=UPI0035254A12
MATLEQITNAMLDVVMQDNSRIPTPSRFVIQAITQRYSLDRPLEVCTDINGSGTSLLELPDGFEDGFSEVSGVEYPVDDENPQPVDDMGYRMRRLPSGIRLQMVGISVPAGSPVRLQWTQRHADDGTTVADADLYTVADLAGALYMEKLAADYIDLGDASVSADSVSYRTKGQEALTMAKALRKRYQDAIGTTGADGDTQPAPAFGRLNQDQMMGDGSPRLIHRGGGR